MATEPRRGTERLVKSATRVKDLAEVFTPAGTVQDMLDLLPVAMWAVHPAPTFLEPACGDGNFLVAILDRKLAAVGDAFHAGTLPAGTDAAAVRFHALEAVASIYGVDISTDNIEGGTPGHEIGARIRMLALLELALDAIAEGAADEGTMLAAAWVLERNIQVGNMLPPQRDALPIRQYTFTPATGEVTIELITMGDAMAAAHTDAQGTLFGPAVPALEWRGQLADLGSARPGATVPRQGSARR